MPMVLVTYDLNAPSRDYNALYEKLKNYNGWTRLMDSTWVVFTSYGDATSVANDLLTVLDKNDTLFTCIVNKGEYAGWLSEAEWTWLRS